MIEKKYIIRFGCQIIKQITWFTKVATARVITLVIYVKTTDSLYYK